MSKVLKVVDGVVHISHLGKVVKIHEDTLDFKVKPNMEVEVYKDGKEYVVIKKSGSSNDGGKRKVNKWIYVILAFLGGSIGLQYAYAGKIGSFIISLLFCWTFLPALASFIDMIIMITRQADDNGLVEV